MNLNDKILEENYIVASQSDGLKLANILKYTYILKAVRRNKKDTLCTKGQR